MSDICGRPYPIQHPDFKTTVTIFLKVVHYALVESLDDTFSSRDLDYFNR